MASDSLAIVQFAGSGHREAWSPALLLVLAAALALAFLWPMVLLLLLCLLAVLVPNREGRWWFLVAGCVFVTALNFSKDVTADLQNYVAIQEYIATRPFSVLFDRDNMAAVSGSYRAAEVGYYGPFWVLAHLLGNSRLEIAIGATVGIYVPTFLGLMAIARTSRWSYGTTMTVVAIVFFAAINVVQTTHLLRQYISSSLLFLAFARYVERRNRAALITGLVACSVHMASGLLLAAVLAVSAILSWRSPPGQLRVTAGRLLASVLLLLVVVSIGVAIMTSELGSTLPALEPQLTVWHYVFAATLFGVFAFATRHGGGYRNYVILAFIVIFTISASFFMLDVNLLALRYFLYLEWLYGLMLGAALSASLRDPRGVGVIARGLAFVLVALVLLRRIDTAPWTYGRGDVLTWDFFQVMGLLPY